MVKARYYNIGAKIKHTNFELYKAPTGWIREDILKDRLKKDKGFRKKFTDKELRILEE